MESKPDTGRLAPWGVERSLWFARWAGALVVVVQGWLFEPQPFARPYLIPATFGLAGALIAANLAVAFSLRRRRVTRRTAATMFAVDLGVIGALVWLYLDNPNATQWVLFMIVQLEAAYRWDMRGAVGTAMASSAFYSVVRYTAARQFDFEFSIDSVTYVLGLTLVQGLVVGGMASKLRSERDVSSQLYEAALSLNAGLAQSEILSALAGEAVRLLEAEFAVVWVAEEDGFVPMGSAGLPAGVQDPLRLPASDPVFGDSTVSAAHQTRQPVCAPDPAEGRPNPPVLEATILPRIWKVVCSVPIVNEAASLGVLSCYVDSPHSITPEEVSRLQALAALAAVAMTNAQAYERERANLLERQRLDTLKDDFLSTISHELRTPLTVVEGFATTLRDKWHGLPDEQKQDLIRRIDNQARQLHERIRDLLDLSQLQFVRPNLRPSRSPLAPFIGETVSRLEPHLAPHPVEVAVPPDIEAWYDPGALAQILENLLVNAARYSPPDGEISIRAEEREQGWVEVSVADRGIGIPPDEQEHIFERFYRGESDAVRKIRGTGIGLFVVKELAEILGGGVRVSSEPRRGSTFTVRLPEHGPTAADILGVADDENTGRPTVDPASTSKPT